MFDINLVKCVVAISFWNLVTPLTVTENRNTVQSKNTNDNRNKRFFPYQEWAWFNGPENDRGFSNDPQYNYQTTFDYHHNNYNQNQHSTYDLGGHHPPSNFDPFVEPNYSIYQTQIPPKLYFNQQPVRTVFQPIQPAYIPNVYKENSFYSNSPNNFYLSLPSHPETNRIIPYHNQINIDLHVHNIVPTNEMRNSPINQDRTSSPPNLLNNFNSNVSPMCPQFTQLCTPNNLSQNTPQYLTQNLPQNISQNGFENFSPTFSDTSGAIYTQQNRAQNIPQIISQTSIPNAASIPQNTPQNFPQTFPSDINQNIPQMTFPNVQRNSLQNLKPNSPLTTSENYPQNYPQIIAQNLKKIIQALFRTSPQYDPPRTYPSPDVFQNNPPNFPNTMDPGNETSMLNPITDDTSADDIDGLIDTKVFGPNVDIGNQIIGPTGSLRRNIQRSFVLSDIKCDTPYEPPKMPNFQKPGRRISEAKCYEYIYQLKVKDELERRNQKCNSTSNNNSNIRSRQIQQQVFVVGGERAAPEEFPHMAAIGWRGVNEPIIFKCGGSLISPNFLLTAAHCRASAPDSELLDTIPRIARIGGNNIGYKKTGQAFEDLRRRRQTTDDSAQRDVDIVNIITHEEYNPNRKYFDVALMQLGTSLDFNRQLKPACLWVDLETSNRIRKAVASGWGVINPRSGRTSLSLQAGELDIIDVNRCNDLLRGKFGSKFNGFADHQLCAGKLSGGIDVCQGDSGGPLQVKVKLPVTTIGNIHSIVGIISAGPDCGKADMPGIYTKVASFIDWIEPKVWN